MNRDAFAEMEREVITTFPDPLSLKKSLPIDKYLYEEKIIQQQAKAKKQKEITQKGL